MPFLTGQINEEAIASSCVNDIPEYLVVDISALKIHMSESAHDAVKAFPEFLTESRGEILIKVTDILNITISVSLSCFQSVLFSHFSLYEIMTNQTCRTVTSSI